MPYFNRTCDKDFLIQFINLYKKNESLWRITSKEYYNRPKKKREYEDLVKLMRTVEPECTIYDVTKKLNSLRSSFRKELRKVEESLVNADEEPYVPKLWYFKNLLFLKETELQDAVAEAARPAGDDDDFDAAERKYFEHEDPLNWDGPNSYQDAPEPEKYCPSTSSMPTEIEATRKRPRESSTPEDECDATGRYIAMKLKSLSKKRRIHAEKRINDVLYEAQLRDLSQGVGVVAEDES